MDSAEPYFAPVHSALHEAHSARARIDRDKGSNPSVGLPATWSFSTQTGSSTVRSIVHRAEPHAQW